MTNSSPKAVHRIASLQVARAENADTMVQWLLSWRRRMVSVSVSRFSERAARSSPIGFEPAMVQKVYISKVQGTKDYRGRPGG